MPKANREELFRRFVKVLGKKYVYDMLDILMNVRPNILNNLTYTEFKQELRLRNFQISDRSLSEILRELVHYKIIVKRKEYISNPLNHEVDFKRISYYFTPLGFLFANKIVVRLPDDLMILYKFDLDMIAIRNTVPA